MPKRSDQLIRRNIPDVPVDKVTAIGTVEVPGLGISNAHPMVREIYESMKVSAQSKYYEPTDWTYAKLTLRLLNDYLNQEKPSAMMVASLDSMLAKLLLTEGDRRKNRIEIERNQGGPEATVTQISDIYRERLKQQQQHP